MKRKPMIKAFLHFDTPKNIKCVNLMAVKQLSKNYYHKDEVSRGINTRTYSDIEFVVDNQKTIYKSYDGEACANLADFRALNEVVCYHIGRQIGIDCAKVEFARTEEYDFVTSNGTISYNTLKPNQILVDTDFLCSATGKFASHTLEDYEKVIEAYKKVAEIDIDTEKIKFDLFKICLFDYLTMQSDRHESNVTFALTVDMFDNPENLEVYPIIDNEYAFATFTLDDILFDLPKYNVYSKSDVLKMYCQDCRRMTVKSKFAYENRKQIANNKHEILEIIKYADKNGYMDFLKSAVEKYNVSRVLNKLEFNGVQISQNEREWYENCASIQKETMQKAIVAYEKNKQIEVPTPTPNDEIIFDFSKE